jgi:rhodanese-related sulfurtransferase
MENRKESVMGRRHHFALVMALCTVVLMIGVRTAAQVEIPRITIHELKDMIDRGESVMILDTQPKAIFEKVHIKGAVSLPWKARITLQDVSSLPRDKAIVTYCTRGSGDSTSANVAEQLMRFGFSDVKVLADPSIKGWKEAGYPLE